MDKKTELELKRAKLEQMRRRRNEAAATSAISPEQRASTIGGAGGNSSSSSSLNVDAEKILIECGITTPVLLSNLSPSSTMAMDGASSGLDHAGNMQHHLLPGSQSKSMLRNKKAIKLSTNTVNTIDIPPRENVTYSKETQTPSTDIVLDKDAKPIDYYVLTYDNNDEDDVTSVTSLAHNNKSQGTSTNTKQQKQRRTSTSTTMTNDESAHLTATHTADDAKSMDDRVKMMKELSEDERARLIQSDDFLNFFTRNTKILEKALDQDDIFFEYGASDANTELIETGQAFKLSKEFHDDRWRSRIVTWLDWSPLYPELLLASYDDSSVDTDGVALVWNSKFKSTSPEFIFNCSSWVTSCCFARFHPNLIIGGTYSGQVVMWDNRSNKRTPIQRSALSASAHTHPIHCIQVVGSQNAHNLISISNDGRLCSWTLDNMNTPQEMIDLQGKQTKQIAVTTMGFRAGDVNNFVVGSEEGPIYTATRHGTKSGINDTFDGHFGPVTGLSCHQVPGPIDFSHLFLTSSFDWTVKLWNLKEPGKPLYSFEHNSDYVYDVQWSPTNPALFASADGTGRLDLWNLIQDSEVPVASLLVEGAPALNKLRWTPSGHQLAVGDDQGKIGIYDVNESYANARGNDDWSRFMRVLADLKESSTEMSESINGMTAALASAGSSVGGALPANVNGSGMANMGNSSSGGGGNVSTPIMPIGKNSSSGDLSDHMRLSSSMASTSSSYGSSNPSSITYAMMSHLKQSPVAPK